MLLHSVACTGLLTWYPAPERLSQRYRVIVFDQRYTRDRTAVTRD